GLQLRQFELVVVGDVFLDDLDRDGLFVVIEDVLEDVLGQGQRDLAARERGVGDQTNQRSFQLPDVRLDFAGDVDGDVVGQRNGLGFRLFLENCDFCLEIGRLYVR